MNPVGGHASPRELVDLSAGDRDPTRDSIHHRSPEDLVPQTLERQLPFQREQRAVGRHHNGNTVSARSAYCIVVEQVPPTMKMNDICLSDRLIDSCPTPPGQKELLVISEMVREIRQTMNLQTVGDL